MGVWLKSRGRVVVLRNGKTAKDPVLSVGSAPVFFSALSAGPFEHDSDLLVVEDPKPNSKPPKAKRKAARGGDLVEPSARAKARDVRND